MRELPEPEASFHTSDSGQWIEGANGTDMFTRDQVLAIQKQAYEDGLLVAAYTLGPPEVIKMLTASQKEQK